MRYVLLHWRLATWRRVSPGVSGAVVLAGLPVLFFMPYERITLFNGWRDGADLVAWFGAFIAATVLMRDSARPRAAWIWPYQKGVEPADLSMANWLLDFGAGALTLGWWAVLWHFAATYTGAEPDSFAAYYWIQWMFVFLTAAAALFPIAALGSSRGVEILVLLVLAAGLAPLATGRWPAPFDRAIHFLLPPFPMSGDVRRALINRNWSYASGELLHLLLFASACLAAGTAALRRWRF